MTASMSGLTISGRAANDSNLAGSQGGGIDNSGNLTLTSMAVTNNAGADGAGITNEAGATLTVSGSTLVGQHSHDLRRRHLQCRDVDDHEHNGRREYSHARRWYLRTRNADGDQHHDRLQRRCQRRGGRRALYLLGLYRLVQHDRRAQHGHQRRRREGQRHHRQRDRGERNNLIGVGGSGGLTTGTNGNQVGVANPLLGPLAINGGSTATVALLSGSPAIGKGSSTIAGVTVPSTDQRGEARPSGSIDIGAYQTSAAAIVIAAVPSETTPTPATISVSVPTVHSSSATVVASPVAALPVAAPNERRKSSARKRDYPTAARPPSSTRRPKLPRATATHRSRSSTRAFGRRRDECLGNPAAARVS